jgi:DNA-binding HxlR family transcriptional regulator
VVAVRWVPLVLRELLSGSRHFAELKRGIPLLSPAMLSLRLKELVDAGVVARCREAAPRGSTVYHLTEAGEELRPVIEALGVWGQRWAQHQPRPGEFDPEALMWAIRRRLNLKALPGERAVLLFQFPDVRIALRRFWLLVEHGEVDLCLTSPGREPDLEVESSVPVMVQVYLGQVQPEVAVRRGAISLRGARELARTFPAWCARSPFAPHARPLPLALPHGRVKRVDQPGRIP